MVPEPVVQVTELRLLLVSDAVSESKKQTLSVSSARFKTAGEMIATLSDWVVVKQAFDRTTENT